jgi:uncharacterized protein
MSLRCRGWQIRWQAGCKSSHSGPFPRARLTASKKTSSIGFFPTATKSVFHVRDLKDFPVLLNALAIRSGTLLNLTDISRTVGIPHETLRRYMALLRALWLIVELPAWSSNLGRRLVRTPKITLNDTGLLAGLLNLDQRQLSREPVYLGQLLESFAVMELRKQMGWSETQVGIFHFKDHKGAKVDIVLESASGEVVGIEVKSAATTRAEDFTGLRYLQSALGERFKRGILLHMGDKVSSASKELHALPLSALWRRYPISRRARRS